MTLDPTFVPAKYHPFIIPCLRRIYLNADPSRPSAASRRLQEQLSALKKENEDLESKLKGRDRDVRLLMAKCESNMAAASTHARGERDARLENERLRHETRELAERYEALRVKFSEQEHRTGSSGEGEARPNDDRQDHLRNQSRSVPRAYSQSVSNAAFPLIGIQLTLTYCFPLSYNARVVVVCCCDVLWRTPAGSSLIRRRAMTSPSVPWKGSLVEQRARQASSINENTQHRAPPSRYFRRRRSHHRIPPLQARKSIVKPASLESARCSGYPVEFRWPSGLVWAWLYREEVA